MAARHKEGYSIEKKASLYFLVCKGLAVDDVGVSRDTPYFRRHELVLKTGDFVKEKLRRGYHRTTLLRKLKVESATKIV